MLISSSSLTCKTCSWKGTPAHNLVLLGGKGKENKGKNGTITIKKKPYFSRLYKIHSTVIPKSKSNSLI